MKMKAVANIVQERRLLEEVRPPSFARFCSRVQSSYAEHRSITPSS